MNEYVIIPDSRIKEIDCPNCKCRLRYISDETEIQCYMCGRKTLISNIIVGHLLEKKQ
jgi:ribosomal protein S27E